MKDNQGYNKATFHCWVTKPQAYVNTLNEIYNQSVLAASEVTPCGIEKRLSNSAESVTIVASTTTSYENNNLNTTSFSSDTTMSDENNNISTQSTAKRSTISICNEKETMNDR